MELIYDMSGCCPHQTDFELLAGVRAVCEDNVREATCLLAGDSIVWCWLIQGLEFTSATSDKQALSFSPACAPCTVRLRRKLPRS